MRQLLADWIQSYRIFSFRKKSDDHVFAFLVHSRSTLDFHRKYPLSKKIPNSILEWILFHMWPITVSRVTGLRRIRDGKPIYGYIIGIPMTARQMMEHREKALQKIRRAVILSRNKGLHLVGLGALTSSLSKGGLDLMDIADDVSITTGHAYTAVTVSSNVLRVVELYGYNKDVRIAFVGASGSVCATTAKVLAREGFKNLLLIDVPRKTHTFEALIAELKELNPEVNVRTSQQVKDIKDYNIVVTATNAPEALITADIVSPGMVIIDDAQPSDIHVDVLKLPDVLAIEAGVVHTPEIYSHFNMNLKHKDDNFCCMAELLILAANNRTGHYVINRATLDKVDEMRALGEQMGFHISVFQNFMEKIPSEKIEAVRDAINRNRQSL